MKSFIIFVLLSAFAFSAQVYVAKYDIKYKTIIKAKDLKLKEITKIPAYCKPIDIDELSQKKYIAKHRINKGKLVCKRNIMEVKKDSVVFKFGEYLEIERDIKVIQNTRDFIKIKTEDGRMEKIYKDVHK